MNEKLNADSVLASMLESIEMLKNASDPNASANEKISVEQANALSKLYGNVVDVFKVKADVLRTISKADENPTLTSEKAKELGM